MLNIGINARSMATDKPCGVSHYGFQVLTRVMKWYPQHQFFLISHRPIPDRLIIGPNVHSVITRFPSRPNILWNNYSCPRAILKHNINVLLSFDGFVPMNCPVPFLPVFHDLNFEHYKIMPWYQRIQATMSFSKIAKRAPRIIAVSEYTKNDIVQTYKVSPQKIAIGYNDSNNGLQPFSKEEKQGVKDKFASGEEFFFFVGSLIPRKNIIRLLLAYDLFKKRTQSKIKLIIGGEKVSWAWKEINEVYSKMAFKNDVSFLGYLPKEQLSALIASSWALLFVPIFEGFGVPLVEAMSCEVPIIASNTSSIPEIAGKAAIFVDPLSIESICDAMIKINHDPSLRKQLIETGKRERSRFSWDETAKIVWENLISIV